MTSSAAPRAMRVAGVVFAALLGALLLVAVVAAGWVGVRGVLAYEHLRAAQSSASAIRADLADAAVATDAIAAVAVDTSAARGLTSDPIWRAAENLPWVGPQLAAVSTVAAAIDDVAGSTLAPLADVAASFSVDALRPQDGRVDLTAFTSIQDAATEGRTGIEAAAASVEGIDRAPLLAPLRTAVDDVAGQLDELEAGAGALANATTLLPAMLGADGPRDYLVLFQNNAEWRSLGGIPGAMALLHTDNGSISLTAQASSGDFAQYQEPVLALDDETLALYGKRPGLWMQNVTQVPDFALTGALAQEMWAREHDGQKVDGVIALDPVTLSYLLTATGPITLPSGDVLTSENAVPLLLNDVYQKYPDPLKQNLFFAQAAASVFSALSNGAADPTALVDALVRAGNEHRLLLWSAHTADQLVLDDTTLAGGLPMTDADTARFGVYVNDGTGSKMDYYTTADATVAWDGCTLDPDGAATGTADLTVVVTSNAPADAASLPRYITGGGEFGVTPGITRTVGYVYLPEGFELTDAQITGDLGFGGGTHDGRRVLSFSVDLQPGQSATATVSARTTEPGAATLDIVHTPTIAPWSSVAAVCTGS